LDRFEFRLLIMLSLADHVAPLCKNNFLQQQYRKIDGAILRSQNEHNLDCVITFQTETILQRFMLRFDQLQLDCNDHLLIYDGAHAIGNYKVFRRWPDIAPTTAIDAEACVRM
jgi:hypothetical protein